MTRQRWGLVAGCATAAALAVSGPVALGHVGAGPSSPIHALRIFKGKVKASSSSANMTYHSGGVETSPAVYIVFWGSWWNTPTTTGSDGTYSYTNAQAANYITSYFANVGGSSWANITSQYCQGVAYGTVNCGASGTHIQNLTSQLKGTLVDTANPVPASPSQSQIAAEARYAAGQLGVSVTRQPGATLMVFTPSQHSMSGFGTSWCAWHSVTGYATSNLPYAYMPYQPDAGSACGENFVDQPNGFGNGYFDGFSVVGGHEYAEAQTDPITARGGYAWYDSRGQEIGDKCAWSVGSANISLNGNSFAVQPLWSNGKSGCTVSS